MVLVLMVSTGVIYVWWPDEGAAETEKERAFCWKVGARVSAGEGDGSVSTCAAGLERAAREDRAALRTEVRLYGRHSVENPGGMAVPVRRALARALAERPALVQESLAPVGPRESGIAHSYLDRDALSATLRAISADAAALRTVRESQESYARSRMATLTRVDFGRGTESRRAVVVAESVGGATGTLTALAQNARNDATRGERIEYYGRHGYPRVRNQLAARARAVGIPKAEIKDTASSSSDLKVVLRRAYILASNLEDARSAPDPS